MRCACGNKASKKAVDPYVAELFGDEINDGESENKEELWCDDCYQERIDDI